MTSVETNNISYNFWRDIVDDVQDDSNDNVGLSDVGELMVIRASLDGIIPSKDVDEIYDYSNANQKFKVRFFELHMDLQNRDDTYDPLISFPTLNN